MATEKKDVFALVFESGRATTITIETGMDRGAPLSDYWRVLEQIYIMHAASGFSHDYPKRLLRNGEPVDGRPIDLAWAYQSALNTAQQDALEVVRAAHRPEWMEAF